MNIRKKMMDLVVTGSTAQSFGKSIKQTNEDKTGRRLNE
jgi:hypothetical protein